MKVGLNNGNLSKGTWVLILDPVIPRLNEVPPLLILKEILLLEGKALPKLGHHRNERQNSPARVGIWTLHEAGIREDAQTHHIHCPFMPINMARIKPLLLEAWNPNPHSLMCKSED